MRPLDSSRVTVIDRSCDLIRPRGLAALLGPDSCARGAPAEELMRGNKNTKKGKKSQRKRYFWVETRAVTAWLLC